jgi:death-on-curing protein
MEALRAFGMAGTTSSNPRSPVHGTASLTSRTLISRHSAYLFGLDKNHGYVDGNKRVAFAGAATFLLLNGFRLTASEPETYDAVIGVVEGRYSEEDLAVWLRANAKTAAGRQTR